MFDSRIVYLQEVFNLTVRASYSQLTSDELTSVDVKHLPIHCIFLSAKHRTRQWKGDIAAIQEENHLCRTSENGSKCFCACMWTCMHIPAQNLGPRSNSTAPCLNNSCASLPIFLEHAETAAVKLQAQAQVSPRNKSLMSCEKGNGEPSVDARAKLNWQPSTVEGPVPRPATHGKRVFLTQNQCR